MTRDKILDAQELQREYPFSTELWALYLVNALCYDRGVDHAENGLSIDFLDNYGLFLIVTPFIQKVNGREVEPFNQGRWQYEIFTHEGTVTDDIVYDTRDEATHYGIREAMSLLEQKIKDGKVPSYSQITNTGAEA